MVRTAHTRKAAKAKRTAPMRYIQYDVKAGIWRMRQYQDRRRCASSIYFVESGSAGRSGRRTAGVRQGAWEGRARLP